jgi:hypothetical protein
MNCAPHLRFSRLVLVLCCCIPTLFASVSAQVAGRNVNMVSGGSFPGGDPFLQKQNEPSLAISTRNACHLLAGANDYRAVNLPGLPAELEIGDAWLGWYESTDCGATWYSTLVPGYLHDVSPAGLASPVKGFNAGADPVVRSGAAGTFYYLFIAFNRGSNVGKLALARAIDHNDREAFVDPNKLKIVGANNPRQALSPIQYVSTTEIARGSSGQFIDKPSLAVFPAATGTCVMDNETVPATNVYVAWTEFVGNSPENLRSKVYFARSADCGRTLAGPATKLSEGYPLGQGTAIGVNPNNPNDIYVVWRQIRNDRGQDALLYARSTDGGRSFSKAEYVPGLGEGQFAPFDQNTTSKSKGNLTTTFRTVAYPTLAFADDGYMYLAVSQVPGPPTGTLGGAQARIFMTRTNGAGWAAPAEVTVTGAPPADGQQLMPALAYAAGKMQLVWYDVRFDEAGLTDDTLIDDEKGLSDPAIRRRRTLDLLGAQATIGSQGTFAWPLEFNGYGVSQPDYNDVAADGTIPFRGPRISQYLTGDPKPGVDQTPAGARQLLFNRGGLLLYGGGTIPFMGDYIDVAPIPFVVNAAGAWVFNGKANVNKAGLQTFQAAWTDNRDANIGKAATETVGTPPVVRFKYEPPLALPNPLPDDWTLDDASCPVEGVDNTHSRDANVYTSRITQDFSFTAPSNSKHNAPGVIRSFAVQLANNRELNPNAADPPSNYRLRIENNARASFSRTSFRISGQTCVESTSAAPIREIFVNVLPRSSAARTIYVPCGTTGPVIVTATDTATGAAASVTLNGDPTNPGAKGPNGEVLGPESHNPDAENPDAENPDAENPDAENPDAENPDAENPDAENPDAENPDAENPDAENPDAENPDAENPDAENPDAENANYQDVTAEITNDGNTTSAYQAQAEVSGSTGGYQFLLMGRRVYSTPTSINCHLVQKKSNQMLFSIPLAGADLTGQGFYDENAETEKHPTFLVRPGESIRVTLRILWDSEATPQPFCEAGKCFERITIRTQAQAPNTGEDEPREAVVRNIPDLTVTGTLAAPAVAGMGGFIDMPETTIENIGTSAAQPDGTFRWDYYRSADPVISPDSDDIGFDVGDSTDSSLDPGDSTPFGPRRLFMPFEAGQTFYIGAFVDADDVIDEDSESNNALVTPTAVTIEPYFVSITEDTDVDTGEEIVTVAVRRWIGLEIPGQAVPDAAVTLIVERPIAQNNEPGVVDDGVPEMVGQTNAAGNAVFTWEAGDTEAHRYVAIVTIAGVGELKFQSCLGCGILFRNR